MAKRARAAKTEQLPVTDTAITPGAGSLSVSGTALTPGQKPSSGLAGAKVERDVTMAPGFVSIYANDTQIEVSPWDVRFTFGEVVESPKPDRLVFKVKATGEVRMSPQHAKRLVTILIAQLERYESVVGPIPQPHD